MDNVFFPLPLFFCLILYLTEKTVAVIASRRESNISILLMILSIFSIEKDHAVIIMKNAIIMFYVRCSKFHSMFNVLSSMFYVLCSMSNSMFYVLSSMFYVLTLNVER